MIKYNQKVGYNLSILLYFKAGKDHSYLRQDLYLIHLTGENSEHRAYKPKDMLYHVEINDTVIN